MRVFSFATAAIVLGAVCPSLAEDLKPASVDQWSGFYVGAHGGYGASNRNGCGNIGANLDFDGFVISLKDPPDPIDSCDGAPAPFTFDYDQAGGLFGVQGGYNWTPAENFLLGVEFSASIADITGELDGVFGGVGTWNGLLTATAKAGVTHDRLLVYAEGGVGLASATFEGDLGCNFTMRHVGPLAGGGVSFKVTDNMSIDLKYSHIWLDAGQAGCTSVLLDTNSFDVNIPTQLLTQGSADVVKLGLNFQLGN